MRHSSGLLRATVWQTLVFVRAFVLLVERQAMLDMLIHCAAHAWFKVSLPHVT
jgi:hypothetical protein